MVWTLLSNHAGFGTLIGANVPSGCALAPARLIYLPSAQVRTFVYAQTSGYRSTGRARVTAGVIDGRQVLVARTAPPHVKVVSASHLGADKGSPGARYVVYLGSPQ